MDKVVLPYEIGADRMANVILAPKVDQFIEKMTRDDQQDNTFDEVATQHRNLMKQNAELKKQYNEHRNGTHHNQLSQSLS